MRRSILVILNAVFLPDHRNAALPQFYNILLLVQGDPSAQRRKKNLLQNVRKHTYTYMHFLINISQN